jgi:sarcosine oxidase
VVDSTREVLTADAFVFACGPWLGKTFPDLLRNRLRTPLGYVYYFGTPLSDMRFTYPNLPSYNFPGITGWPALLPDNRGFRVRTGGGPHSDPDTSQRWIDPRNFDRARAFLIDRFALLADAPLLETRACHYELTVNRNFIIDRHPLARNVWIVGGGSAGAEDRAGRNYRPWGRLAKPVRQFQGTEPTGDNRRLKTLPGFFG